MSIIFGANDDCSSCCLQCDLQSKTFNDRIQSDASERSGVMWSDPFPADCITYKTPKARLKAGATSGAGIRLIDDKGTIGGDYFENNIPCTKSTYILEDKVLSSVITDETRIGVTWTAYNEPACLGFIGIQNLLIEFYFE